MNSCQEKIQYNCPPSTPFAKCVKTELTPPVFSGLLNSCNSVEDILENEYTLIGNIKTEIDLSGVTSSCGTLPVIKNTKTLIQYLLNRDCAQQLQINDLITRVVALETKVTALQANPCN